MGVCLSKTTNKRTKKSKNKSKNENNNDEYSDERDERYGKCSSCKRYNTYHSWCQKCDPQLLTKGWSSGNKKIDEIIKSTQIKTQSFNNFNYLQWIPFDDLTNVEKIGEGGFSTVYKATWLNGKRSVDEKKRIRYCKDMIVALKKLNDSQNISDGFLLKLEEYIKLQDYAIVKIYGLSKDPTTNEYIFVMQYAENGNLQHYLQENFTIMKWKDKISTLYNIIWGLHYLHRQKAIHRDLHTGNILKIDKYTTLISDLGLSIPANQDLLSNSNTNINDEDDAKINVYGVLPYIAPEVLRNQPYIMASDVYSFGVLMSVISTGQQPFKNLAHDTALAIEICNKNLRPEFSKNNTPKFFIDLACRCMNANPDKRPTSREIFDMISFWHNSFDGHKISHYSKKKLDELELIRKEFDGLDDNKITIFDSTNNFHPKAVYTSRLLNFHVVIGNINDNNNNDDDDNNNNNNVDHQLFNHSLD